MASSILGRLRCGKVVLASVIVVSLFATMSFVLGDPAGIDSQYMEPAVAMVDGAVQRFSAEMSPAELRAMCTANGHESDLPDSRTEEMEDARLRPLKPTQNPSDSGHSGTAPD